VCRACIESDSARVAARVGIHRVCACCVEWERGLSVLWDKKLGVWLGFRVHGVEDTVQQAHRITNGAKEVRSHEGVDISQLEKAESLEGVAFVHTESS
jgi:hypothetical protein